MSWTPMASIKQNTTKYKRSKKDKTFHMETNFLKVGLVSKSDSENVTAIGDNSD